MNAFRYILRSVAHYRFAYLGVLAGAALGATVLLGALFAGDSVAASLRAIGEKRIGRATHILASGDRFFREALADDFSAAAGVRAAPVLLARGTATNPATRGSANQVQLVGVTPAFWQFAPQPPPDPFAATAKSAAAINETLARRLQLAVGDTLVVRVQKPGVLSGNAPSPAPRANSKRSASRSARSSVTPPSAASTSPPRRSRRPPFSSPSRCSRKPSPAPAAPTSSSSTPINLFNFPPFNFN
jgi:hypothetical protein